MPRLHREAVHIIVFILHLFVFEEGLVLDLRHADGVEQMAVRGDMDGLDVRERGQHHQHLGGFEHLGVVTHVAIVHLDIRLGEEAENLREQVALPIGQVPMPILDVVGERHFLGQPMHALLHQPRVVGPGVTERLINRVLGQKIEADRVLVCGGGKAGHAWLAPWG